MSEELATKVELTDILDSFEELPEVSIKEKIAQLDAVLIQGEQVDCPLEHQFADGLYSRERFIPANTLFTTYTWKHTHFYFCNIGELLIFDVETATWGHFQAPCRGITLAGTKRIVYAITDVMWSTIHANPENETNIAEIEGRLLEKYENEHLTLSELKKLQKCQH